MKLKKWTIEIEQPGESIFVDVKTGLSATNADAFAKASFQTFGRNCTAAMHCNFFDVKKTEIIDQ